LSNSARLATPAAAAAPAATAAGVKRFVLLFAATALAALVVMILLPHDKYLRYQSLNDHVAPNAYWIYQRIHDDPTPIDIAFIGTSRTGRSVNTKRLEEDLSQQGVMAKAANFYIFKAGRNMHYAVAKELLEHRSVKLLVLEMTEWEDRKPHPDFIFLADPADVVFAPTLINLHYFSDLARLPGRQVDLFLETTLQQMGLREPDFVPPPYQGPNMDSSEYLQTLDGTKHYFLQRHSFRDMEKLRLQQEASVTPAVLPPSLGWLEYRYPRYYVERILDLAQSKGTKVVFLYVPRYGGPPAPAPYQLYARRVKLLNPGTQMQDYRLWDDESHLNWYGAQRLTDSVADQLARGGYLQRTPQSITASSERTPAPGSSE
jgi:hypothetical protein